VRHVEEKYRESEKNARKDSEKLKILEAQITKLTNLVTENAKKGETQNSNLNGSDFPAETKTDPNPNLVKNARDNPGNGFFSFV
jgi:hypothetical protein